MIFSRSVLARYSVLALSLGSLSAACSAETGNDGEQLPGEVTPGPVGEASDPGSPESLVLPEGAGPVDGAESLSSSDGSDKAGCTYIQYCDYPNNWVGTRCIWSSCSSFCGAVKECVSDTRAVCGSARSTWTILTSAGDVDMASARAACGV